MNLPAVMLNVVTVRLARISPSATVMALPIMGTKAKNAIIVIPAPARHVRRSRKLCSGVVP